MEDISNYSLKFTLKIMAITSGTVLSTHKFALHDGPGIRTTVFLKGCPLKCKWCHNPESISHKKEVAFFEDKCTLCGACVDACPNGAHSITNNKHIYNRNLCQTCSKCVEVCNYNALELTGIVENVKNIISEIEKDSIYFNESGGGVTISGGEPLAQPEFAFELLKAAKSKGIHTCLDTSGQASKHWYEKTLPYVDLYLFDYKETVDIRHKELTGVSNKLILENLDFLYKNAKKIELRCPIIPSVNDSVKHFKGIVNMERRYPNLQKITILPYHNVANDKYRRYGYENFLQNIHTPTEEIKEEWRAFFLEYGCKKVFIE